jgi:cellulose synthase/poly-beta-1,6-N-acetylglucosamine synthase-like glycosyltransferase
VNRLLFWGGVTTLVYTLVGFPLLVLLRGKLARRGYRRAPITPEVSLIVSARNEEAGIGAKLDSLLALDYPREQLDIVVASDGSQDRTDEIVAGYQDRGVRLLALARVGKATALNEAVAATSGEIIVFSDANSLFAPTSLTELVAPFADPNVGGVAGDQRYLPAEGAIGERSYWDFDRVLKMSESRAGNVISATGAIYAIRRELFEPVPDAVTDDFVISTGVIERGRRLVFAADAVAYEPASQTTGDEFGRKVRIMTRGFRSVIARRALLDPRAHGFYAVQLISHKVLRRLMAVPLLAVAVGAVGLWREGPFYRLATIGQVGFYAAALIGLVAPDRRAGRHPILALPAFFCMVNWAGVVAAVNVLRGHRIDRWEPVRSPLPLDVDAVGQRDAPQDGLDR